MNLDLPPVAMTRVLLLADVAIGDATHRAGEYLDVPADGELFHELMRLGLAEHRPAPTRASSNAPLSIERHADGTVAIVSTGPRAIEQGEDGVIRLRPPDSGGVRRGEDGVHRVVPPRRTR
jgi:hypothetical protein